MRDSKTMITEFFLEPIRFFNNADLLDGKNSEILPHDIELVTDLDFAMTLENSQDPPKGYKIWHDEISGAIAPVYSSPIGREGRVMIDKEADQAWANLGDFEIELRKKKIRKTITVSEEFWLTVAYDILENLKNIALGRYVNGQDGVKLLENIFLIYRSGFYPCGIKFNNKLTAFDVRVL